jgi:uncharacterized protein involved in exopolysaccharide biosynthesis
MNPNELTILIYKRLRKYRIIVISGSLICMLSLILFAKQRPITYTSRASIFPLTGSSDNNATSSALSALLGVESTKSFSDDASINIIELAQSRTTREEVAAIRDSSNGNKTIAELLVDDINNHRGWFEEKVKMPPNQNALITWAGETLKDGLNATVNKNNMLVLTYTGRSPELVRKISYGFINKISLFYIQLKQEKARIDFQFATSKVDSLRKVMGSKDNQLISIDQRTMFTNTTKLQYRVPTENLLADKEMIRQQYATAVANQQNAAYKLQKATPVIKVLDKPDPPYDVEDKSAILYGLIGLIAGFILMSLFFVGGLITKYAREEIKRSLFGASNAQNSSEIKGTPATIS